MRDIKFRGLTEEGKWVYGYYFKDGDKCYILKENLFMGGSLIINRFVDALTQVLPETVGQYTGLKDKSGKEIWGGNKVKAGDGKIYEVVFDNGRFTLRDDNLVLLYGTLWQPSAFELIN